MKYYSSLFIFILVGLFGCESKINNPVGYIDKGVSLLGDSDYTEYIIGYVFNPMDMEKIRHDYESGKYASGLCQVCIPDVFTAYKVAKLLLTRQYGEESILRASPLEVTLIDSLIWHVSGSSSSSMDTAFIELSRIDGRIIVNHWKKIDVGYTSNKKDDYVSKGVVSLDSVRHNLLMDQLFDPRVFEEERQKYEMGLYDNAQATPAVADAETAYELGMIYLSQEYGDKVVGLEEPFEIILYENLTWDISGTAGGKFPNAVMTGSDSVTISISRFDGRVFRCCDCPKGKN